MIFFNCGRRNGKKEMQDFFKDLREELLKTHKEERDLQIIEELRSKLDQYNPRFTPKTNWIKIEAGDNEMKETKEINNPYFTYPNFGIIYIPGIKIIYHDKMESVIRIRYDDGDDFKIPVCGMKADAISSLLKDLSEAIETYQRKWLEETKCIITKIPQT